MIVAVRILTLLLSLFVTGAMSVSAYAIARLETRAEGSPEFEAVFASPSASQVARAHQENLGCSYDFSSRVHKYLYCHDDPIDNSDPSGHETLFGLTLSTAMRATIAATVLGGVSGGFAYAKTRSAEAAFQAGLNTYGAVFFSVAFPPAGLAIGAAGAVSLGTHVWADGLTAMDAAEIATMFAASVALHASFQRYGPGFPNRAPSDTPVTASTVSSAQAGRMTGLLNYVVT